MVVRTVLSGNRFPLRYSDEGFALLQRGLQRGLDEVLKGPRTSSAASVRLDVREDEEAYHVTAELAGLSEQEIDVTFDENVLTIKGEKKIARDQKKDKWHLTERVAGKFQRSLSLPEGIDDQKIEARFEKGVLHITLTKKPVEVAAAKKISIKSGA